MLIIYHKIKKKLCLYLFVKDQTLTKSWLIWIFNPYAILQSTFKLGFAFPSSNSAKYERSILQSTAKSSWEISFAFLNFVISFPNLSFKKGVFWQREGTGHNCEPNDRERWPKWHTPRGKLTRYLYCVPVCAGRDGIMIYLNDLMVVSN